ncbi:MAG: tryptophan--tRNA ligase [Fidelibacterota bacterium]|nr:MAG: tryptophan--tRNA ligase [Candidatus Neomarinimicrobiota bacterium]
MKRGRILSGMRPTGKLHLGHYMGALENWVALQETYDNFHLIADYHALTTRLDTSRIAENTLEMLKDWLAAGIDPGRSPIFRQSRIKEHTELFLILSMLITAARLERNPTLKEQVRDLNLDNVGYGHLGYPVLQTADILLYKGELVPVGEDQAPHVEISRELARKFNRTYGEVFPEPKALLTQFARLPGLDGQMKMSKSLGNAILMSDEPDSIQAKLRKAVTDPLKVRKGDPGRPEVCLVFTHHTRFSKEQVPEIRAGCESGSLGCVECKRRCAQAIADQLEPFRQRRRHYDEHPDELADVLNSGEARAKDQAQATMAEVRQAMGLG